MDNLTVIEKISSTTGVKYSDEQLKILKHQGGMCILACAGAGKTTTLVHLIAKRILTGEIKDTDKILCTTYTKMGCEEIGGRIKNLLEKLNINKTITVKTLHASYLEILRHCNIGGDVCTNGRRMKYIKEVCKDVGVRLEEEELQTLESLLSYQINNLITDEELVYSYVYTLENVSHNQYKKIRYLYNKKKEEDNMVDFDDMQLYMYYMLVKQKDPKVTELCREKWKYFFIDEFQDVSKIQFAILKQLITDPNNLVVIGDDDQCIYQWRGADPNIILNIQGYYDIKRFILSTNYRCAETIVTHAANGIKNNKKRVNKTIKAYHKGGSIKIGVSSCFDLHIMSLHALKYIKDRINEGCDPKDIAILSRNNQQVAILGDLLLKEGIYYKSAPKMKLTSVPVTYDIENIIKLIENTTDPKIIKNILWKIIPNFGTWRAEIFSEMVRVTGWGINDVIGFYLKNFSDFEIKINVPKPTHDAVLTALAERLNIQSNMKKELLGILKTCLGLSEIKEMKEIDVKVTLLLHSYYLTMGVQRKSKEQRRCIMSIGNYLINLLKKHGLKKFKESLELTKQYEKNNYEIPESKVEMSTIHGAKGREWKYVILFADDNVTFPSFERILKMYSNKNISLEDISNYINEERRLHYVAFTRAKEEILILTDGSSISVFTLEKLGFLKRENTEYNQHIIDIAIQDVFPDDIRSNLSNVMHDKNSNYYIELE